MSGAEQTISQVEGVSDEEQENLGPVKSMTVADAVWLAAALLHEGFGAETFTPEAIVQMALSHQLTKGSSKSIWQHVNQHCVANRKPNPNRSRMLFATGNGDRRLFRDGDGYDPAREGSAMHPEWSRLPEKYRWIQQWYETKWSPSSDRFASLLALIGTGREIWKEQHADEYVAELRANWLGE